VAELLLDKQMLQDVAKKKQRPNRQLENREISSLQFFQELGPFRLGSGLPHDPAAVDRLTLTLGLTRRPVWQKIIDTERVGVGPMGVQRVHQRRSLLDHPDPRMAVAVDPTLVPLGQAEPPLQLQVVLHRRAVIPAGEQAGAEAAHQVGHVLMNRVAVTFQAAENRIEFVLACG
jgi:hypothetical protein